MHKRFFSEQTRYRRRRKAQRRREQREAAHAAHPLRTSLPFLCLSGVVLAGAITAASCTLCYQVEAQGQTLAFFQDPGTYDQAVAQAEDPGLPDFRGAGLPEPGPHLDHGPGPQGPD